MDLDDETREQLGSRNPWPDMLVLLVLFRDRKRTRDRAAKASDRESRVVKLTEAAYQRAYAATEAGKERRRAASRAYKARRRAS